jgi:hypothetical protein
MCKQRHDEAKGKFSGREIQHFKTMFDAKSKAKEGYIQTCFRRNSTALFHSPRSEISDYILVFVK